MIDNLLNRNDKPNIIFYGNSQLNIINDIQKHLNFDIKKGNMNLKGIDVIKNKNIYLFQINLIKSNNYNDFNSILLEIISSKDYYYKFRKTIILTDFDKIQENIQLLLRVYIEKYSESCSFIFITKKLNYIIEPLRSRSLCIRIKNDYESIKINFNDKQIIKLPLNIFIDKILIIYKSPFSSKNIAKIKDLIKKFALLHLDSMIFNYNIINFICYL